MIVQNPGLSRGKILGHLFFWFSLWLIFFLMTMQEDAYFEIATRHAFLISIMAGLTYLNIGWLIPKFYLERQYILYILLVLLSVILASTLLTSLDEQLIDLPRRALRRMKVERMKNPMRFYTFRFIARATPLLFAMGISSIYQITRIANRREQESTQLRSEKLETEMKFLKSQTNPHFLFNALNNIYALTVVKSDRAPDNLLKLSNMLRYMLYDCNAEKVALQKEIEYLKNYIDLKLLKDSQGLNVKVHLDDSNNGQMIAPMLFIPFVENAFKHSKIEDLENGWITIELIIKGHSLHFIVANSRPSTTFTKDQVGGIGLQNVKRQLELLYPGKHRLQIDTEADRFSVDLVINLV